jgi:hypothetical protein
MAQNLSKIPGPLLGRFSGKAFGDALLASEPVLRRIENRTVLVFPELIRGFLMETAVRSFLRSLPVCYFHGFIV